MKEKKLATFRIDSDQWIAFQEWAKRSGTNASALLVEYIEQCLLQAPTQASRFRLEGAVTNIDERLERLERKLKSLEASLEPRIKEILNKQMSGGIEDGSLTKNPCDN